MSGWDSNNRVRRLVEAQKKESLAAQYQIVTVHFPTANTDVVVRHDLQPPDPEYVDFEVLNASGPPMVYVDKSPTRVSWGNGYVVLRSAVEGLKCEIRLSVSNIRPGERTPYEAGPHAIFELSATRPQLQLRHAGATARGRVHTHTSDAVYLGYNVSYDGSGWNLDDTTLDGIIAQVHRTTPFSVWKATAGTNPRSPSLLFGVDGNGALYEFGRSQPLGVWTTYTPTWNTANNDFVLGNGVSAGYYTIIGKTVIFYAALTVGTTTTMGTGAILVTIPTGNLNILGPSTWTYNPGGVGQWFSTNAYAYDNTRLASVYGGGYVTNANPGAFAANNVIWVRGCYEYA